MLHNCSNSSLLIAQVVPGGLVVKDQKALHETTDFTSPGVLAYVTDDEALMLRVPQGWQYVGVGFHEMREKEKKTPNVSKTSLKKSVILSSSGFYMNLMMNSILFVDER